ncbi:D-arabinono-1,4-lactone oxidase [Corynebacterium sp. H113]|uniref:D-arabinono-1,4-lactone oxidase n=1 Tax=Corynebacterium sp. H113 TaxID=3133419 RepID=UPI0030AC71D7
MSSLHNPFATKHEGHDTESRLWSNWSRTQTCEPARVHSPESTHDIAEVIRAAAAQRSQVRPLGAGHSFTPVATTSGHRVQLDNMSGLLHVDREAMTVTLRAGTRLRDVPALLRPLGLSLANQGDVDPQSVAGAVSTGTHGTGLNFTGFAGMLRGFRIICADAVEYDCYEGAEGRAGELFRLARLGLGVFGVLTELTLDCVPAFHLAADEHPEDFDDVRINFTERVKAVDHMEFYWFPGTSTALVKENTRIPDTELNTALPELRATHSLPSDSPTSQSSGAARMAASTSSFFSEEVLNNGGLLGICELSRAMPRSTRALNRFAASTVSRRKYVDESHRVFVSPRRVRFSEMEYAIALDDLPEVLGEIRSVIDRHRAWVSFPLEIRAAKSDDVALSTAYQRDSAYIAVHRYWKEPYARYFFDLIEPIFKEAGGRPHWGKLHTLNSADLRERYPLFDDVAKLRSQLDPQGLFLNSHLRELFGA